MCTSSHTLCKAVGLSRAFCSQAADMDGGGTSHPVCVEARPAQTQHQHTKEESPMPHFALLEDAYVHAMVYVCPSSVMPNTLFCQFVHAAINQVVY